MKMTQAERLARIETLLEGLPGIRDDIRAIRKDLEDDKAELAMLKNKGVGFLVGVGIVASAFGATAATFWEKLVGMIN